MNEIANMIILGNRLSDFALSIGIFIVGLIVLQIFRRILLTRLKRWAAKTPTKIDDIVVQVLQRNIVPLLYLAALYLSVQPLQIPAVGRRIMEIVGMTTLTIIGVRVLTIVVNFVLVSAWRKRGTDEAQEHSFKPLIGFVKILIWGGGIILLLDNVGFKVSAIIAGLGIGGVAVALAAQAVLGDVFSFFAIMFDRPFELGDFIIIGDFMGTVEYIGIKTTRLRSLGGEQLVFSNTDLTNARVRNYKRMGRRRVLFKLGVTYQTTVPQLREIPRIIKTAIAKIKNTTFDRAHFASFGDFSLTIEVVYYVLSADYNVYMDIQQQINLSIAEEFAARGIEFAYPTQTVYVTNTKAAA